MDNEEFQKIVLEKFSNIEKRFNSIDNQLKNNDTQFKDVNTQLKNIDNQLKNNDTQFKDINTPLKNMDSQLKENTQILKALMHSAEVNKSEHDKMFNELAHIKGDNIALKKDVSKVELITSSNSYDIALLKAVNR